MRMGRKGSVGLEIDRSCLIAAGFNCVTKYESMDEHDLSDSWIVIWKVRSKRVLYWKLEEELIRLLCEYEFTLHCITLRSLAFVHGGKIFSK